MSDAAVHLVRSQFALAARETAFAVIAYCFMPDHVHLAVNGETADSDCRRFIKLAKQYSGFYYARRFSAPLWQRYGFERVLRATESTTTLIRYIIENPVRAGIVTEVSRYPYSTGSLTDTVTDVIEFAYRGQSS
jgi:putative transposase